MSLSSQRTPRRRAHGPLHRRRPRIETLENRRVLANLGIDIGFYLEPDEPPNPGDPLPSEIRNTILRGETFYVKVQVEDMRDGQAPQGVIGLPLNLDWNSDLVTFANETNLDSSGLALLPLPTPPGTASLVTDKFPFQRSVGALNAPNIGGEFSETNQFDLKQVRGGAIPALSQGSAIGVGEPETFSTLEFTATENTEESTETFFTVALDGAMSFADAAVLQSVVGLDRTTVVSGSENIVHAGIEIVGGSISGTKFNDLNGDGIRDANEPGIPGVEIRLLPGGNANDVAEVTTDSAGNYVFSDLPKGVYSVREVVPTGSTQTTPLGQHDAVSVDQDNQNPTGVDFGNFTLVTLSGTKFNDINGDGVQDAAEEGVANVEINLDLDSNGTIDRSVLTASDGSYAFTDVGPGKHTITETLPSGSVQTFPDDGEGHRVIPTSGDPITDLDFGNNEMSSTVSGSKFDDFNGDGIRQTGERGVGGVTIQINVNNSGTDVRSVVTEADGTFTFENIPAGMHSVAELKPENTVQTTPGGLEIFQIDVRPPATVDGLLFGNFTTTTLSGTAWEDVNNNGIQDAGDTVIENVTMHLDLDDDGSIDFTALTDANGHYEFTDVGPGDHRIIEIVPPGFISPPIPKDHVIENRSGKDQDGLDFLNRKQPPVDASIHGFVYTDNDFDGIFDPIETGLPGVAITLTAADGSLTRTTTTGPDGAYVFADLPAGTYRITETQPDHFGDASISLGKILPGGSVSGTTDGFNAFDGILLGEHETAIDYNFGEVLTAVTKRMFRASTNVRAELSSNAGAPGLTIPGTPGDDRIVIENRDDAGFQIFINDVGWTVSSEQAPLVMIDAMGGNDRVEYRGSGQAEQINARPGVLTVAAPDQSIGVFHAEEIRVQGGGGDDTAFLRDSSGADTLTAADSAVLMMLSGPRSIGVLDVPKVKAISDVDGPPDTATIETIDFVLQLAGDWN